MTTKTSRSFRLQCQALLWLQLLAACSSAPASNSGSVEPSETEATTGATAERKELNTEFSIVPCQTCGHPIIVSTCGGPGEVPCCGDPTQAACSGGETGCQGWYQSSTVSNSAATAPGTCEPCGGLGSLIACFVPSAGETGCAPGYLEFALWCEPCGGPGQPVCAGNTCLGAGIWDVNGTCMDCGGVSQPACGGTTCPTACGVGCQGKGASSGASGIVVTNGTCEACGENGQPVCSGGECDSSTGFGVIVTNGTCEACGENGQPACSSGECDSSKGLVEVNGECLPLQTKTWTCESAETSGVAFTAPATLTVSNAGVWAFTGALNSQAVITQNFYVGVAVTAFNAAGQQFVQGQGGSISSEFANDGSNNQSWSQTGYDSTIAPNWAKLSAASMSCKLEVSPNIGTVVQAIFEGLGIVAASAVVVLFADGAANGHGVCASRNGSGGYTFTPGPGQGQTCPN